MTESIDIAGLRIETERVDDIPLVVAQMRRMELPVVLDSRMVTHGNRQGLSIGWTVVVWLAHVLSEADHWLSQVGPWAAQRPGVRAGCSWRRLTVCGATIRKARIMLSMTMLLVMTPVAHVARATSPIIAVIPLGLSGGTWSATAIAVDSRAGRVLGAASGPTTSLISVLNATTGAVTAVVADGPAVQGVVVGIDVDEARGHALVLTDPDTIG